MRISLFGFAQMLNHLDPVIVLSEHPSNLFDGHHVRHCIAHKRREIKELLQYDGINTFLRDFREVNITLVNP